jgi:hypothetical protein
LYFEVDKEYRLASKQQTMVWHPVDPTEACLRISTRYNTGVPEEVQYEELSCLYPALSNTYFNWEYKTDYIFSVWEVMDAHPWIPVVACALYVIAIFGGQAYMKDRPAWDWRYALAAWNLLLSVFSVIGFFRTAPQVLHNMYYYGLRDNVCESPYKLVGVGPVANWGFWFLLSKFAELFDTFFIVVRKVRWVIPERIGWLSRAFCASIEISFFL